MSKLAPYAKAVAAFAGTVLTAVGVAVASATPHTFAAVDTLGWISAASFVVASTAAVYGVTNKTDALGTAVAEYREARAALEAIAGLIAPAPVVTPPTPAVVPGPLPEPVVVAPEPTPAPTPEPAPEPVVIPPGPVQVITPPVVEVPVTPAT